MLTEVLQLGGVGAFLGLIIFLMYRHDRNATEKMWKESKESGENRLTELIEEDQKSREKNTEALTELTTLLKRMNGRRE